MFAHSKSLWSNHFDTVPTLGNQVTALYHQIVFFVTHITCRHKDYYAAREIASTVGVTNSRQVKSVHVRQDKHAGYRRDK